MSDNIPFEIQTDIIQRIPDTKSLIRCRSVSKEWKSLIDSKEFVTAHTFRHQAHNRHLLIQKLDYGDKEVKYVSIVDDDTFPHQKHNVFVPDSVHKFINDGSKTLGSCHGLLCLYKVKTSTALIWNPFIRKSIEIAVPKVFLKPHLSTVISFGVCPRNLDPKLVKITYVDDLRRLQDGSTSTQVEVFTLLSSGGTWRSPLSSNLPRKSIWFELGCSQVVVDGVIYWDALGRIDAGDVFRIHNLIMSFDLTSEEFTQVNLPDCLALNPDAPLSLSNLRDSLAVLELELNEYSYRESYHVWMMVGHGCIRSFNKLYSINAANASIYNTLGFLKTGAPIVEVENDNERNYYYKYELAIHEPESETNTKIGIHGAPFVHFYMETLLLLGH